MGLKLQSVSGGSVELNSPITTNNYVVTMPAQGGTVMMAENYQPSFKNRIINGAMMVDQRNAGTPQTDSAGNSPFSLDRWRVLTRSGATITYGQYDSGSSVSRKHIGITITSGKTPATSDQFRLNQTIEGLNIADLWFGTSAASTITLSFWSCHSQTGTFSGSVFNGGTPSYRSYVFTYTQNAANTWEYKTVTIVGDTTGTWATDNTAAMNVSFNFGCGSDFLTSTVGSWLTGAYLGSTGSVSPVQTTGVIFRITGVQLEKGSTATSFDYRPYGTELALCQRYYYKQINYMGQASPYNAETSGARGTSVANMAFAFRVCRPHPVEMRTTPTAAFANIQFWDGSVQATATGINSNNSTKYSRSLDYATNINMGGTGYTAAEFIMPSGYVECSAEL